MENRRNDKTDKNKVGGEDTDEDGKAAGAETGICISSVSPTIHIPNSL